MNVDHERRIRALEAQLANLRSAGRPLVVDAEAWTPLLNATTGGYNGTGTGRYWRVNSLVYITGRYVVSSLAAPTGTARITALPLTSVNVTNVWHTISISDMDNIDLTAGYSMLSGVILPNTTEILLRELGDNALAQNLPAAAVAATTTISFSGWYVVG